MGAAQTKESSFIAEQSVTGGAGSIHRAFVRERDEKANLEDFYEILEEIGRGGLCAVFKIRKKHSKIGGTSRSDNVKAVPLWASPFRRKSNPVLAASNSRTALNKLVGEGNFVRVNSDGAAQCELYFAMKEINLALVAPEKVEQLKYEVEILKALDHKNIIKAYETFQASKKVLIVMELCNGGDLHSQFPYTEARAAQIARQILSAVSYMHSASIIHRDIKLENIIFERNHPESIIKVIDFGLSVKYSQTDILKERVGTLYSMSPETLRGDYTEQADVWSIGVCVYMLLSQGDQPFEANSPKQLVAKILRGRYNFDGEVWDSISSGGKDFVRALLEVKLEDRICAPDAKTHPWIEGYRRGMVVDVSLKQRVGESMIRYASQGEFLKLALNIIAKKSTCDEIFELSSVFDEFDSQNTGRLGLADFKSALGQFGYSDDTLEDIFYKIDVNQNNEINYTEFLAAALEAQGSIEEHRLAEAFDVLDTDDSGYISRNNLREILGDLADEKYIDKLLSEADFLNDGRIWYSEFLQAFSRHSRDLAQSVYGDDLESKDEEVLRYVLESEVYNAPNESFCRKNGFIGGLKKAFSSQGGRKDGAPRCGRRKDEKSSS